MNRSRAQLDIYFKNYAFLKKTVILEDGDYVDANQRLMKIMKKDKVTNTIKFSEYYIKPTRWRRTFMYERCKRIYDSEMSRKINFLSRMDRENPWIR